MLCLGLDIGSTTIKGAVLDLAQERVLHIQSRPFPQPIPGLPAGYVEIDPRSVVQAVESILDDLSKHVDSTSALMVCGQMGGVIMADERGDATSNYLSWRDVRTTFADQRGPSFLQSMRTRWSDAMFASLGNELQAGSTTILLAWLVANKRLNQNDIPLSIADYVISHLCKQPGRMHATHAIGMLDAGTGMWHRDAFERFGICDARLPALFDDTLAVGSFQRQGKELRVHGSFGDQQSALYGAGIEQGQLSINISTGSQVSVRVPHFQSGPYQSRKYFDGDWLNTVTHLPAGRALNGWVELLLEVSNAEGLSVMNPWKTIAEKMERCESTNLQANIALFPGPMGAEGNLQHLTLDNLNVGNLFLGLCNAMVENYVVASERLDEQRTWTSAVLSGGLSQALPRLVDLIRQRFGLPVRESVGEETLVGLLKLAKSIYQPSSLSERTK